MIKVQKNIKRYYILKNPYDLKLCKKQKKCQITFKYFLRKRVFTFKTITLDYYLIIL